MKTENLMNFIEEDEIRLIAKNAELGNWEWGTDNPLVKLAMIEGAAIMLREFLKDTPLLITGGDGSRAMLWHLLELKFKKDEIDIEDSFITAQGTVGWADCTKATDEPKPVYVTNQD